MKVRAKKNVTDTKDTSGKGKTKEIDKDAKEVKQPEDGGESEEEEEKVEEVEEVEETKEPTKKEKPTPTYRNGAIVMAKVQGKVSKNIWFTAKVVSSRQTALGPFEYHVAYTDEVVKDAKEWVPERFVTTPINTEALPPPSSLVQGTLALGWRKKPGAQAGWWHSVKVLRYLNDVPGAFVQWMDFPFPDSILESGKVYPILKETPTANANEKEKEKPQTGIKRQLSEPDAESTSKKEKVA